MAETKTQAKSVVIDGVEYGQDDLSAQQVEMLNHVLNLDNKIASARFQLDQLNVGRQAFFQMLKDSLEEKDNAAD